MRKIITLSFFLYLQLNTLSTFAQLYNWQYRVPIAINENSATNLADYQALIDFDTQTPISQGKMKVDGGDIRFAENCADTSLLNYYIESGINTISTKIWVKVSSIPASSTDTIYLFYGNSSAFSVSNKEAVFPLYNFYPWFSGWSSSASISSCGSYNMLGGYNLFGIGAITQKTISNLAAGDYLVTFNYYHIDSWDGENGLFFWNGVQQWSRAHTTAGSNICGGGWGDSNGLGYGTTSVNISHSGGNATLQFNSTLDQAATDESWGVDSIRVRKYVFPEPTISPGVEQNTLCYPQFSCCELPGWQFTREITIDNSGNTGSLTDFQVLFILNTQLQIALDKMNFNCSDIRFLDSDCSTPLDYWIESGCNTNSTLIWVKVPSIPVDSTKVIYLHYGNTGATDASNGDETFEFFDDFDASTLDTAKWDYDGYYSAGMIYSLSNSILSVRSDVKWRILRALVSYPPTAKVIAETKFMTDTASLWHKNYFVQETDISRNRFGLQNSTGTLHWRVQYRRDAEPTWQYSGWLDTLTAGTWYIDRIEKQSAGSFHAAITDLNYNQLGQAFSHSSAAWSGETWTWVTWKRYAI